MDKIDDLLVLIILNYNDYDTTNDCIAQLLKVGVKYQIIVVDNCSTNNSYTILFNTWENIGNVRVIKTEKNGGYSYGNNQGIFEANKIADFKYYCIMNPDVIVEENYFKELCSYLDEMPEYAVISPLMVYPDKLDLSMISWNMRTAEEIYKNHFLLSKRPKCKEVYKYLGNGLIEADTVPGSFFIIKSKDIKDIGYFDDNIFLYNEETVMAKRLNYIQKKLAITLKFYFIHNHRYEQQMDYVWYRYKNDFNKIIKNYLVTYESRKYMCKAYYNGKYIVRLKIINLCNLFLLYIKHVIAILLWRQ